MKRIIYLFLVLCISILVLIVILRKERSQSSVSESLTPVNGDANHSSNPVVKNDTLKAVIDWVSQNAIPLQYITAGNGFEDLQSLGNLIGSDHVVALGEATHGTREFYLFKHRVLEFLVTAMGFTVFGIEASMPEAFDINEYVVNGKGDPEKALAGLYNWVYNTGEVLDMIKWMRRYNADPGHTKKVKFYGFDMQSPSVAVKKTLQYVRKLDPAQAEVFGKHLAMLGNPFTAPDFVMLPKEKKEEAANAISAILKFFVEHKSEYIRLGSESEWDILCRHATIVAQHIGSKMNASGYINLDPLVRDRSMSENIRWILDHEGDGTKMVIWAHNMHFASHTTMGSDLRKTIGTDMFVLGFAFDQGTYQAAEFPIGYIQYLLFPSEKGVHPFTVTPFRSESGISMEGILSEAGLKYALIDLKALPKDGPVGTWFREGQFTRNIGSVYMDSYGFGMSKQVLPETYDAIFFAGKTTASHLNESGMRPPAPILSSMANPDFESGVPGESPAGWLVPKQSAVFDFSVTTSESSPFTGKQCAVISRTPGQHYGEMYGSLSQQIDATPYRGKTIRLNAAVRTDVSGTGNQAYLWLRVTKRSFGPSALLFYDNMSDRSITNSKWNKYTIECKVSPDAEVIGFGLALVGEGKAWIDSVLLEVIGNDPGTEII